MELMSRRSRNLAFSAQAGSTGQRNQLAQSFTRLAPVKALPGPTVELAFGLSQVGAAVGAEVGTLGKELTQEAIGVFIGRSLPR
jgi:hypothetical protein